MPIPSTYDEDSFKAYLVGEVLVGVATELEWTVASADVQNAVNETLLSLDVEDFTTFTTGLLLRKVRAFGRREIWRQAMNVTAAEINVAADGASVSLSNLHNQCRALYLLAAQECLSEYGGNVVEDAAPRVVVGKRACPCDPYTTEGKLIADCIT